MNCHNSLVSGLWYLNLISKLLNSNPVKYHDTKAGAPNGSGLLPSLSPHYPDPDIFLTYESMNNGPMAGRLPPKPGAPQAKNRDSKV